MTQFNDIIIEKIKNKTAIIGVVGLGYVGLPLCLRYSDVGYQVLGIDTDKSKVALLNEGASYLKQYPDERVQQANANGFHATSDFSMAIEADVLVICVPTPLGQHREPDLSFVKSTVEELTPYLRKNQLVSLESTTYPGTTSEVFLPAISSVGLVAGQDLFLVYSPEREDPGNRSFSIGTIPKVIGGYSQECLAAGSIFYGKAVDKVVEVSSLEAAEMTKLLENIHRAVNIGLINEMKIVATQMDIDIYEVIRAAATKPFGFTPYYPGPGLGGHCIPIDPFYLTWKAREYDLHTRFIELAGEVNSSMPKWVVERVIHALNSIGKSVKGAKILMLGVAYKKNIEDTRESPALVMLNMLLALHGEVEFADPHVSRVRLPGANSLSLSRVELSAEKIASYDLVLVATDHDEFDFKTILECASLIVDTRGVYQASESNVIRA